MERSRIPNRLKKYRRMAGLSQRDVAAVLQLTYASRLSRWEHGISYPDLQTVFILSLLYKTHPFHLYPELWQSLKQEVSEREGKLFAARRLDAPPEPSP